jgi:cell division protein FtsZ
MTGVQSAQVLGSSTQQQANESRRALSEDDLQDVDFDAKSNAQQASQRGGAARDGGSRDHNDDDNNVDVIR